jgi:pimeloyl-ACP methyl ester carboxylesterase
LIPSAEKAVFIFFQSLIMRDSHSKKRNSRKKWMVSLLVLFLSGIAFFVLGRIFPEENKRIRGRIRAGVAQEFPDQAATVRSRYGIWPADGAGEGMGAADRHVILVHGLDDPGKVWMNLRPKLEAKGFQVWIFSYPDDQAVSDSARFFFEEMRSLRKRSVASVSVVAHSMGGLVAREMLTDPEMSYENEAEAGLVPGVSALLMIATPNHGSELAPLRFLTEFRDQFSGLFTGDYVWIEGIMDGTGEAGIDLTPGSPFLEALNGRPHPENLRMAVIAGIMDPLTSQSVRQSGMDFLGARSRTAMEQDSAVLRFLDSVAFRLGDGVVSVASARLEGYPLYTVEGTHLSIIRNLNEKSERLPPAVPLVMDFLESR